MKKYLVLLMTIGLLVVMAACTEGTAGGDDGTSSDGSGSDDGGEKDSLVIGFESDAATLIANNDVNYVTDTQIRNIYDPLIERDAQNGDLVPVLAEDWENVDELTWRLTLKEGVKFHNGADFNAESVKFSIDYILDEANNSAYRSRWVNVEEVIVLSDYEVEIKTSEPFPSLLDRITEDLLIMEPGYVEEVGTEQAAKEPIGTGAYQFVEWSRDNYLQLEAFEDHWRGEPSIKNLEFRYIPEFSSRMSAFLSGEIDLFKNIPVDSVEEIESSDNAKIEEVSSSRINYLTLNTFHDGPLQDVKVRQAINYAVDVDELLESVLNGYGTKMTGPLAEINSGYVETDDYGYDPDKAVELIEEAGYDPESMTLSLDTPNGRYPMDSHVAQGIAAQLSEIGIEVEVQVNEWGNHLERIQNREMGDMFILGWGPAFTPQSTIENLFTENAPYSSFHDPEIEERIHEVNTTFDDEERMEGYAELQHVLVEQAAWVPLWQQADLYAVRGDLNFNPRVDEKFQVHEMSWE
ncbi:ABC transporter substrate-binding protein [Oceanobacillus halotolerans]|uniref:ABC transporter substrate-binding protein n=1 Tax=Oceanobacillus halotolerans TaxID=2663380 RepID=UPI0013DA6528|nr:ABC transporter substrate-binding protein [Oceanobacillus halotolerans]